jgi:hypothetical protein
MSHGISTEWEDIHVKLGNYLPRDKQPTNDDLEKITVETLEKYDPLEKKNLNELKELEDDEDEEILKIYEAKRMAELKEFAQKPKFGKVAELRKQDYIAEVTNAPKDVYVVLLLYKSYIESSNILSQIFDYLAEKHVLVKFMRIVSDNCIEDFEDKNVPAVIVYKNSQLIRQFIPATYYFGGKYPTWKSNINLTF